jgi:hypothetical protein
MHYPMLVILTEKQAETLQSAHKAVELLLKDELEYVNGFDWFAIGGRYAHGGEPDDFAAGFAAALRKSGVPHIQPHIDYLPEGQWRIPVKDLTESLYVRFSGVVVTENAIHGTGYHNEHNYNFAGDIPLPQLKKDYPNAVGVVVDAHHSFQDEVQRDLQQVKGEK